MQFHQNNTDGSHRTKKIQKTKPKQTLCRKTSISKLPPWSPLDAAQSGTEETFTVQINFAAALQS